LEAASASMSSELGVNGSRMYRTYTEPLNCKGDAR
jgi:hypothetical protein